MMYVVHWAYLCAGDSENFQQWIEYIYVDIFDKEEVWNIWMDSNKFQHEVEIIVIEKSNIYDWIMVEIFELRVLANI